MKDGFVGVMKGVIWGIAPEARIADLTHLISPQNIREGGVVLDRAAPYFPAGTIHIVVVDSDGVPADEGGGGAGKRRA